MVGSAASFQRSLSTMAKRPLKVFRAHMGFYDTVVAADNADFTIEEINSRKMALQKGAFFLGWDRNYPQFDREREFAHAGPLYAGE